MHDAPAIVLGFLYRSITCTLLLHQSVLLVQVLSPALQFHKNPAKHLGVFVSHRTCRTVPLNGFSPSI